MTSDIEDFVLGELVIRRRAFYLKFIAVGPEESNPHDLDGKKYTANEAKHKVEHAKAFFHIPFADLAGIDVEFSCLLALKAVVLGV